MDKGWDLFTPGCDGTLPLSREVTLATRSVLERLPTVHQPMGFGFLHLVEPVSTRAMSCFVRGLLDL